MENNLIKKNYKFYNNKNNNKWNNHYLSNNKIFKFYHNDNIVKNKLIKQFEIQEINNENINKEINKKNFINKLKEQEKIDLEKKMNKRKILQSKSNQIIFDKNKSINLNENNKTIKNTSLKNFLNKKPNNFWNKNYNLNKKCIDNKINKKIIKMDENAFIRIKNKIDIEIKDKNDKLEKRKINHDKIYTLTKNKVKQRPFSNISRTNNKNITKPINNKVNLFLTKNNFYVKNNNNIPFLDYNDLLIRDVDVKTKDLNNYYVNKIIKSSKLANELKNQKLFIPKRYNFKDHYANKEISNNIYEIINQPEIIKNNKIKLEIKKEKKKIVNKIKKEQGDFNNPEYIKNEIIKYEKNLDLIIN